MKALFLTPIEENKKQQFLDTGITCIFKDKKAVTKEDFKDIDIVFGNPDLDMIKDTSVQWIQLDSAGANAYCSLPDSVVLTNAKGAYNEAISEHMLACTLAVYKNLFAYEKVAQKHEWTNLGSVPTISQLKVLSIGMGNIGSAYAKLMHTLGAKVYGLTRTKHELPDYLEGLYTFEQLDEVLADKDVIALSLPETEQTKHLFNYERLHQIKQGAMIINVGRGSAIVTKDLVRIMKEKHLRAACLDVTEYEPLPKNMDLWNVENVYITPHISGRFNAQANYDNVIHIFHKNLLHFINKEPLENIVDKKQGY